MGASVNGELTVYCNERFHGKCKLSDSNYILSVSIYQTLASLNTLPNFYDFGCSSSELSLNQCRNPAGARTSIINCRQNVMGIQCAGNTIVITLNAQVIL